MIHQKRPSPRLAEYLTVAQAAQVLGVSPWTLRNWDKAGKLKPGRHPKNGYRIYKHEDLTSLLEQLEEERGASRGARPHIDLTAVGAREHFVQFYETDEFLVESVSTFVAPALEAGDGGMIVATRAHRAAILKKLKARGLNVAAARADGRLLVLDADDTLSRFMLDGEPDLRRFHNVVGGTVAKFTEGGRRLRAFGEMVALLWQRGHRDAAIQLEQLWSDLAESHSFALMCAYPMSGFANDGSDQSIVDVCTHHSRVIPAESYAALQGADERRRTVAKLQRRALSLDAEIAHRKEVEKVLSRREHELNDLVENAPEGLHQIGPDGKIMWANRAELNLLGYEPHEYIGHHVSEFHVDGNGCQRMLEKLMSGEKLYDHPARLVCGDGSIKDVLIHSNACFEDGQFVYTRSFTRDVTERLRAEEELRLAKAAAERASRAKDQFLSVLGDELRAPLTPVVMSVAALEAEPNLTPRMRENLVMIRRKLALETQLIDDLLDLSRIANGKMSLNLEKVSLHTLVRGVVEIVQAENARQGHEIHLELKAEQDQVTGDSARLQQVVWNLLNNAVKFTPEPGRIVIRTRNDGPSRLVLEVQDNGIGIETEALPRLFSTFEQCNSTGLGLAICKAIAAMHKGSIRAESDGHGRGACFVVELETCFSAPNQIDHESPNDGAARTRAVPLEILLVDDHADTLRVLGRLLEACGHRVTTASNVAEAVSHAGDAAFDVLISDIGLPDGTGLDLIRQLRTRHPRLRGIALTGFSAGQDLRNSADAGFSVHLTKPIELKSLEAAIAKVVSGDGEFEA